MINTDRIVPVTVTDLITLYGNILTIAGTSVEALDATDPGVFTVSSTGTKLAAEPVKSLNFTANSATIYFIPSLDYVGFSVNGEAVTTEGVEISADGRTLYTATLGSGKVTIAKVGF